MEREREEALRRLENAAPSLSEIAAPGQRLGLRCVLANKRPRLLFGNTAGRYAGEGDGAGAVTPGAVRCRA